MEEENFNAHQYGNFKNYYKFASSMERIELLPTAIWDEKDVCHALDIGCNVGELTGALHQFIIRNHIAKKCHMLGVDMDSSLIKTANETYSSEDISFRSLNVMDPEQHRHISNYLEEKSIKKFDIVFCFSTTMWLHINHGDERLKDFLREVVKLGKVIVIEPQSWKSYKNAEKRMRRAGNVLAFPLLQTIQIKNPEIEIKDYLINKCNCQRVWDTERTKWERKTMIFKTNADS